MAIIEYFFLAIAALGLVLRFYQHAPAAQDESLSVPVKTRASRKISPAKAVRRVRRPWVDSTMLA